MRFPLFSCVVVAACLCWFASLASAQETVRFAAQGIRLPGCQFMFDAGFELLDFNDDGKLDLFFPHTSMIGFVAHLNDGTPAHPRFGPAVGYPINLTETTPQTIEHNQTFAVCDLNHDGLFDMIFFDGQLRMDYNTGTAHGPNHWHLDRSTKHCFPGSDRMIKENARFSTGPESFFWIKGLFARQVLTLGVADWDGDGLEDLLISRFKEEAPGVTPTGGLEQWTPLGRRIISQPQLPPPPLDTPAFLDKLPRAPERGLYFYKNVGTKEKPWFDAGVEILTPDGKAVAAPNPVVFDVDGDGIRDLISTETAYSCNAYRVDWPTNPTVAWYRRPGAGTAVLEPARPLADAAGRPIPAGVQARVADFRQAGVPDLFVLDPEAGIRWYQNRAKPGGKPSFATPVTLSGGDFNRFGYMYQPLVVNWFGPNSRDLILHGCIDAHCKFALRRTALYKNVATRPGEIKYAFAGYLNFRGDLSMVPKSFETRPHDVYGSAISLFPPDGSGKKRLMMSVDGQLYLFTNLAADGLTFQERTPLNLPAQRNRCRGWQEIPVTLPDKVQYIRVSNDPDGQEGLGIWGDHMLNIITFEALAGGKNVATVDAGATVEDSKAYPAQTGVQRPLLMLTPGNQSKADVRAYTSLGYWRAMAIVKLKEPATLDRIRMLLSDRDEGWFGQYLPFYWQGKLHRLSLEQGEPWYQYKIEVSADKQKWTTVANTMKTEMARSYPLMVDWNGDGKTDLLLGVVNTEGQYWHGLHHKEYRLYLNTGTNDAPRYAEYQSLCDEKGQPLKLRVDNFALTASQCGIAARDLDGDGKLDLIVEDNSAGMALLTYRNVSADPAVELKFQAGKPLGSPKPIRYTQRFRYFYVGDVDGDDVLDLINCGSSDPVFFKGHPATAPSAVETLNMMGAGRDGVDIQWNKPAGAARYELRVSDRGEIREPDWVTLTGPGGDYTAADGQPQTVRLPGLPAGTRLWVAVRSLDARGQASAISDSMEFVTPPLRRVVLRNGPAGVGGALEYAGAQGCYLDAKTPAAVTPKQPSRLSVRAHAREPRVILLRFTDIPTTGTLRRATLEMTTDPSLQADPGLLQELAAVAISCNSIRDDWDPATATFTDAAAGKPWGANELIAGGTFHSKAGIQLTIRERRTLSWDVTEAVRAARQSGKTAISLLVRIDYTGKYVDNLGYEFCGHDFPRVEKRPRLRLDVAP